MGRKLRLISGISFLLLMFAVMPALAETGDEGFSPELFLVDDAYAPEKGEFGVWLQPKYFSDEEGTVTWVDLTLEYGLTDHLLLEVFYQAYKDIDPEEDGLSSESGSGDLGVGIMYAFGDEDARTHFAVGLEYTEPTGDFDKGMTEGYRVYEPFIAVSHDLESGPSIHANLSYEILDQREKEVGVPVEEENEVAIAVAYVHPLSGSLALMFEAAMESSEWLADGEETEGMAGPEIAWEGESGIQVGTAVHFGLTDDSADWAVLFNIGMEFELGDDD